MFGKKGLTSSKSDATTYIGHGMRIEGKIRCVGPIRIDGEVHGDIECQNEVSIGPTAFIEAVIRAMRVVVNGRVEGNLYTTDQLEVLAQGHIVGNVSNPAGKLIIHEGAVIEGQCLTYEASPEKKVVSLENKKLLEGSEDSEKSANRKA